MIRLNDQVKLSFDEIADFIEEFEDYLFEEVEENA